MYPHDNIFNIYYNIGRNAPIQVKRFERGLVRSLSQNRHQPTGRTFIVKRVEPKGKYGKAYGYCFVDRVRSYEYLKGYNPDYKIDDIADEALPWLAKKVPDLLDYTENYGFIDFYGDVNAQLHELFGIDEKLKLISAQFSQPKQNNSI